MLSAVLAGFALSGGLIVAIGAQNAFVIRQGVLDQHVLWICLFCALSDMTLICSGTLGWGAVLSAAPALLPLLRYAGAAFLIWYGFEALRRALRPGALAAGGGGARSLRSALALCAAFTWLNPHVYLDTLVFLGSVAATQGAWRWWFAVGAVTASLVWFTGLGFGARLLAPIFARASAWRALDALIAVVMIGLGLALAFGSSPVESAQALTSTIGGG